MEDVEEDEATMEEVEEDDRKWHTTRMFRMISQIKVPTVLFSLMENRRDAERPSCTRETRNASAMHIASTTCLKTQESSRQKHKNAVTVGGPCESCTVLELKGRKSKAQYSKQIRRP